MNTNDYTDFPPTDWEDYWSYKKRLSGSFASEHFQNAKVEKLASYNDVVTLTDEFISTYPLLSKLLNLARVTKIITESNDVFYILGWSYEYGHFGGLVRKPIEEDIARFHESHNLLLRHFGGFIDEFGEIMDTSYLTNGIIWQLSYPEIKELASQSDYLKNTYYQDTCEENNVSPTLNLLADFVQFTEESSGDFFMYDKRSGDVWMFRYAGYGDGVIEERYTKNIELTQVEGASESLFFKLNDCSLVDWIEHGANAWLTCFEEHPF